MSGSLLGLRLTGDGVPGIFLDIEVLKLVYKKVQINVFTKNVNCLTNYLTKKVFYGFDDTIRISTKTK